MEPLKISNYLAYKFRMKAKAERIDPRPAVKLAIERWIENPTDEDGTPLKPLGDVDDQ